jgi:hypothetical protein
MIRRLVSGAIAALLVGGAAVAQEYRPAFRPETLKGPPAGKLNEVLVLGTPHLSDLPRDFDPMALAPLLDRLAGWRPTGIATEDLSGLQCDALRRYPSRYAETVEAYCPDPAPAGRAIGLDVPAANAEAERLLAAWPAAPSPAQRRRLAAVFLAAGEPNSALVQWLRLPAAKRHAGDGLDAALVAALDARKNWRSESSQIAALLAARLGLERLWSVDDHSADTPDDPDPAQRKAYQAAIERAWDNSANRAREAAEAPLRRGLSRPGGLLAYYRLLNAPQMPLQAYRADFGAALTEPSPQQFGRGYVGYWETRNLRMVSNIRDVLGRYPGMRMLALAQGLLRGVSQPDARRPAGRPAGRAALAAEGAGDRRGAGPARVSGRRGRGGCGGSRCGSGRGDRARNGDRGRAGRNAARDDRGDCDSHGGHGGRAARSDRDHGHGRGVAHPRCRLRRRWPRSCRWRPGSC